MSERLSSASHSSGRLAERRSRRRRRILIAFSILSIVVCGVVVYGLWQPAVRISHVTMYGADQSLGEKVTEAMQGMSLGIPRDSTFFVPESDIRSLIMNAHPDIAAVSIFRNGLTGLSIKIDNRVPVARWCGVPPVHTTASSPPITFDESHCYFFDASGFVYATTTTAQLVNAFTIYESVENTEALIGAILPHAEQFPAAFDFARQMNQFGSSVSSVVFRSDEVDMYLKSGSRITYLLSHEQDAFTALVSARANFDLSNGSIEYIDLRFPGKVYLKRNT